MTTETVSTPFNIAQGQTELAALDNEYQEIMTALVAAGSIGDVTEMGRLGSAMVEIGKSKEKLERKITKALNPDNTYNVARKIEARTIAFNALQTLFADDSHAATIAVRDLMTVAPGVKKILINVKDGMIDGFDVTGGFREVTKTGTKRPRAIWSDGTTNRSSKEVIFAFGVKYGQAKDWDKLSASERQGLLNKIVEGENLTNVAPKVTEPANAE